MDSNSCDSFIGTYKTSFEPELITNCVLIQDSLFHKFYKTRGIAISILHRDCIFDINSSTFNDCYQTMKVIVKKYSAFQTIYTESQYHISSIVIEKDHVEQNLNHIAECSFSQVYQIPLQISLHNGNIYLKNVNFSGINLITSDSTLNTGGFLYFAGSNVLDGQTLKAESCRFEDSSNSSYFICQFCANYDIYEYNNCIFNNLSLGTLFKIRRRDSNPESTYFIDCFLWKMENLFFVNQEWNPNSQFLFKNCEIDNTVNLTGINISHIEDIHSSLYSNDQTTSIENNQNTFFSTYENEKGDSTTLGQSETRNIDSDENDEGNDNKPKSKVGLIVGIVVGVVVILGVIITVIVIVVIKRKKSTYESSDL